MPESPEITVVIPTRDRWSYLSLTLASALGQEDVDLEAIVVVDGSGDETAERLAGLGDRRIRTIRNGKPRGVARARNAGLAAARGEWIAFLDDDDVWAPRKLRAQLDAAERARAAFAYCAAVVIDETGAVIDREAPPPDPHELPATLFRANLIPAPGSNVVARTAVIRRLGGFDEGARFDDWDMWIRLAAAETGAACSEVLVAYRRHRRNRALADRDSLRPGLAYLVRKHRALAAEHEVSFDELAFSRWVAFCERRSGRRLRAMRTCLASAWAHRKPAGVARAIMIVLGPWAAWSWRPVRPPATPGWLERYQVPSRSSPEDRTPRAETPPRPRPPAPTPSP